MATKGSNERWGWMESDRRIRLRRFRNWISPREDLGPLAGLRQMGRIAEAPLDQDQGLLEGMSFEAVFAGDE